MGGVYTAGYDLLARTPSTHELADNKLVSSVLSPIISFVSVCPPSQNFSWKVWRNQNGHIWLCTVLSVLAQRFIIFFLFFIVLFFYISIQYGSCRFPGSFSLIISPNSSFSFCYISSMAFFLKRHFRRHACISTQSRRENHRRVVFTQQDTIYSRTHLVLTNLLITSLLVLCFPQ